MTTNTRLAYTSSTQGANLVMMARVAAGARVKAERVLREEREIAAVREWQAQAQIAREQGQSLGMDGEVEWCFICSRPTDHWGEHTPEQIAEWKASRGR